MVCIHLKNVPGSDKFSNDWLDSIYWSDGSGARYLFSCIPSAMEDLVGSPSIMRNRNDGLVGNVHSH